MVIPVRSGGKSDGDLGEWQTLVGAEFAGLRKRRAAAAEYKRNSSEGPHECRVGTDFSCVVTWLPKTLYPQSRGAAFP